METQPEIQERNSKFGAKADFIRNQPEAMSAAEVVELAAQQGLKVSVNHVYNLRNAARRKGAAPLTFPTTPDASRNNVGPKARARDASAERQLRLAIAEVGLRRASEIMASMVIALRGE